MNRVGSSTDDARSSTDRLEVLVAITAPGATDASRFFFRSDLGHRLDHQVTPGERRCVGRDGQACLHFGAVAPREWAEGVGFEPTMTLPP